MKHIKPGRGPSMMGGIMGIFMVVFGIGWTVVAMQGGLLFALFGIVWTCMAIVITIYNFSNATRQDRYSTYDIVDSSEEPDPMNQRFVTKSTAAPSQESATCSRFCPYCGSPVVGEFTFCPHCGKKLPVQPDHQVPQ